MKTLKILHELIDKIYIVIFVLIMLIGLYFCYDTVYIFYNASGSRILASKGVTPVSAEEKTLTEDYIAWLSIGGTRIDYPIMQGQSNATYLNRNPYGEYSLSGSIFADYRNAFDFKDDYTLLYGHHMSNGYMFGCLDEYYDRDYFDKHTTGTLTLKDGTVYKITLFTCIKTDAEVSEIFNPQGADELFKYLKKDMLYAEPVNRHIIALSTCLEPGSTTRTVVFGCLELMEA